MQNTEELKNKLLNSEGVKSLIIESTVFNNLKDLGWQTYHSPYFTDPTTRKLRELDVKARKYFKKDKYSCALELLVECKNLNNYHIIANNKASPKGNFDKIWLGNYIYSEYNKLDEILLKHNFTTEEVLHIKEKLNDYCFPDSYRWADYLMAPFEIPTFNAYRETNVNTTKDIDNSVIWKCILSLQSASNAHVELLQESIEYMITENMHQELSRIKKLELLIKDLNIFCNHLSYMHQIIVVDAQLWEFTTNQELKHLKYFRLNIQHFFGGESWVDIVNFKHLKEYLDKSKKYIEFHKKLNFKIH